MASKDNRPGLALSPEKCTERAREILQKNDRGVYTVPTDALYPHQWNWDSAFSALAWAQVDERRAWAEITSLLAAQWANGMVPHIVYHSKSDTYYPDLPAWGERAAAGNSSGITQNPVAASCALELWERARDRELARQQAAALVPRLAGWHRWFFQHRRDPRSGLIAIVHPWESRDNACDWDAPLDDVDTSVAPAHTRKDLLHVNTAERPTSLHYQQFLSLVVYGRRCGWEINKDNAHFWVADPFLMSILVAAERDLIVLAEQTGETEIAREARGRCSELVRSFAALWDREQELYHTVNLLTSTRVTAHDIGMFLPLYAGIPSADQGSALIARLEGWLEQVRFGVPSHDPQGTGFEPRRYWRGPVWLVVNYLIAKGLVRYNRPDLAEKITEDSRRLVYQSGFSESFDPLDGSGLGGREFSWTAAMWLAWLKE